MQPGGLVLVIVRGLNFSVMTCSGGLVWDSKGEI